MFTVAAFYHFFDFPDFAGKRPELARLLQTLGIKGSLILAPEGINGTLTGEKNALHDFLGHLERDIIKCKLEYKESLCERHPFGRAKVRLKKEIISMGVANPRRMAGSGVNQDQAPQQVRGRYIEPKEWNALIASPDVTLVDARNHYEIHLGTFEGAIDPGIRIFKQLPAFVKKNMAASKRQKIATFCTGGIRCEKFSAWLLEQGFEEVYQLKGGILKYLEEIPAEKSRWNGECYVFDERVAVGHGLAPSKTATMCPACGWALTSEDRKRPDYEEGKKCRFC